MESNPLKAQFIFSYLIGKHLKILKFLFRTNSNPVPILHDLDTKINFECLDTKLFC